MKFSVIIPTYNRGNELAKSIESVLNQTYIDFELIIVDNGSIDNTKDVVYDYIDKDKRVRYFWQENSGSPAGSRNTGIKNALNEWIAFLDSDDYWYAQKLEEVSNIIKDSQDDLIAVSHYEYKEVSGKVVNICKNGNNLSSRPYSELLFNGNVLSTSSMSVRKDKLLEVNMFDTREDYFAVEDYDLWMKLAQVGEFAYSKKVLGVFCISDNNMSGNVELINDNLRVLIYNHIDKLNVPNKNSLQKEHAARIEYYRGRTYQLNGQFKKAIPILIESIIQYPMSIKKYIALVLALFKISKW